MGFITVRLINLFNHPTTKASSQKRSILSQTSSTRLTKYTRGDLGKEKGVMCIDGERRKNDSEEEERV